MTESNPPPGEVPKKKSLKLLLRSKPVAEVETSIGRIYLYPMRVRDMTDFGKLEPADALTQVRHFLTSIGSLTVESDAAPERIPLDPEISKTLSDDEFEQLAEAYVQSSEWQTVREGSHERKPVAREPGDTASTYLIRLVKDEVENQHDAAKQLREKMLGSSRGLFDQVRKSYTELGSTVKAFEAISRPTLEPSLSRGHLEINNQFAEHSARMERERSEELEMVRLTGKMTAESAKTLKDLAEAATILMEQLDERDRKSDKFTREQIEAAGDQIRIGVWSIRAAIVLGGLALMVSGLSLFQDWKNNASGDQWQTKLLTAIDAGNQHRSAAERENQALRDQVNSLDSRTADLEAAQRVAADANKEALADRPVGNPGSTRAP